MARISTIQDNDYVIHESGLTLGEAIAQCIEIYEVRDWKVTVLLSQAKKSDALGLLKSVKLEYREAVIVLYPHSHTDCERKNNTLLSTLHHEFGELIAHIHMLWLNKKIITDDGFDRYRDSIADHVGRIGLQTHLKSISGTE